MSREINSNRLYSLREALEIVASGNEYSATKKRQLHEVFSLAQHHILSAIREDCSYRLLKKGQRFKGGSYEGCYISIIIMNYLLFRVPAYGNKGEPPQSDCYLIFSNTMREVYKQFDVKNKFNFRYFACSSLELSFDEVLGLSGEEWSYFRDGCRMAAQARRFRSWVSNIEIT